MSVKPNKKKAKLQASKAKGRNAKKVPIEIVPEAKAIGDIQAATPILHPETITVEPGQQVLINAAKYLVANRLELAALKPLNGRGINVRSYETLTFMTGSLTEAEKDLTCCLDLIGDVLTGREQFSTEEYEAMCLDDDFSFGELTSPGEVDEVINRFHKDYRKVGGGKIRNAGMKPGYDAEALMKQYRSDPTKFRLLKATSNKRFHIVLFGTLYSFVGKKQAAAAGKR